MNVIETEKATDVIVEYFDLICDTDYAFDETEILRRMNANAIDAVPVIRCKDCKHQAKEWRADKRLKGNGYMVCGCDVVGDACGYWALLGNDEDFCSMAEPKEKCK